MPLATCACCDKVRDVCRGVRAHGRFVCFGCLEILEAKSKLPSSGCSCTARVMLGETHSPDCDFLQPR